MGTGVGTASVHVVGRRRRLGDVDKNQDRKTEREEGTINYTHNTYKTTKSTHSTIFFFFFLFSFFFFFSFLLDIEH